MVFCREIFKLNFAKWRYAFAVKMEPYMELDHFTTLLNHVTRFILFEMKSNKITIFQSHNFTYVTWYTRKISLFFFLFARKPGLGFSFFVATNSINCYTYCLGWTAIYVYVKLFSNCFHRSQLSSGGLGIQVTQA